MKKILIIDEKTTPREDGTGTQFLKDLPENLRKYVQLETRIPDAIKVVNDIEVHLLFDVSNFEWVFYHDSYKDKNLDEGLLKSFQKQVPNLIIFSGGPDSTGFSIKKTSRAILFAGLQRALKVGIETGFFPVKSLCDSNIGFYYPLFEILEDKLLAGDISAFLKSRELLIILKKLNYSEEDISNKILMGYSKLSVRDLFEKLNNWKFKNI